MKIDRSFKNNILTNSFLQRRPMRKELKMPNDPISKRFLAPLYVQLDTFKLHLDIFIFLSRKT